MVTVSLSTVTSVVILRSYDPTATSAVTARSCPGRLQSLASTLLWILWIQRQGNREMVGFFLDPIDPKKMEDT